MSINYKEWLNNDELAINIFEKKYRNGDESLDQWLERVTAGDEEVKRLILEKKFLPGGRVLANRGVSDKHGCLNNCFVLPSPEDSIEGIYKTAAEIARTFSYGGGVGINISTLRPKGLRVNNAAQTTSGAVSFIDLYDTTANLISQGQRRGALMVCMNSDHPDIEEFVDLKADLNKATKANVSVMADDEFMERAVDADKNGYLAHFSCSEIDQEMSKPIDAAKLFNKIAQRNWEMAEPGMLFYNNINNNHILSEYDEIDIRCPNPCLHPDTFIETTEGRVKIKDMTKPMMVYSMDSDKKLCIRQATPSFVTKHDAETITLKLNNGSELILTPDHLVFTKNKGWVKAEELTPKDYLVCIYRVKRGCKYAGIRLTTQAESEEVMEHRFVYEELNGEIPEGYDVHHLDGDSYNNTYANLALLHHNEHATLTRYECDNDHMVQDEKTGRFISTENSRHGKKEGVPIPEEMVYRFGSHPRVVEIISGEKTDVYDITVEDTHNFIANGVVVHNCGEIPMEPGSACLLASFNLAEYVDDSVHRFKLKEFAKDVRTVVVFMEKLQEESIDLLPLQIQKDQAERWKRIGIGIMGLADALIKMRVRYGSPDSLRICDQIGNVMAHEALIASEKYGLEHGSFIGFDETKVNNSDYVKRHVQHVSALRNGSLLTIAPTGTLSTMLGVSGGIEPLFDTIYTRKTESLDGEDKYYHINAPIVQKYMDENGMCGIDELPDFFITAKQVPWKERIAMQSVWQQHIDQAISSTVNLPEHISVNEIGLLYEEAWRKGLKGITVYRDNCRRVGILTSEPQKTEAKDDKIAECVKHVELKPVETPSDPIGKKRKLQTGCGSLHCIAFFDKDTGQLMEVYLGKGSQGGCQNYMIGLARMLSLAARSGIDIYDIVDQLNSSGTCPSYATRRATHKDTSKGSCCPVAIGNALVDMYQEMQAEIDRGMYWDYISDDDEEEELFSDVKEVIKIQLPEEVQPFDPSIYSVMKYHQMPIQPLETERGPVADPKKKDDRPNAGMVCPECQRVIPVKTGGCWSCPSCGWSKCN